MQSHMAMMSGMSANSMRTVLASHRQTVANTLSRMNADMQQMNMSTDAAWTALADSIRNDLTRMPDMTAAQLKGAMIEGHVPASDVRRLLAERPSVAGLAVPGMPMGSPGMEGPDRQKYQVLAFTRTGRATVYASH